MSEEESHKSRTCVLWVTTYPEHVCGGLVTFCLFSHIPQVSLFVMSEVEFDYACCYVVVVVVFFLVCFVDFVDKSFKRWR